MSAFVLENDAFVQIADELASHAENPTNLCDTNYQFASYIREYLGFSSSCFDAPGDAYPEAVAKVEELHEVNVRAVNDRYESTDEPSNLRFVRRSCVPQWSPVQLFKHLQCLRYQMAEGDVPESAVYKDLDALISNLCGAIVTGLPEYESSAWDIESRRAKAA